MLKRNMSVYRRSLAKMRGLNKSVDYNANKEKGM